MTVDDSILVRRCLLQDAIAIRDLISRFQDEVYNLCLRMLSHRQDAEDMTQETFVRVFRSLKSWDSSRPLRPWIFSIAINRCRTMLTQRVRRPELADYLNETPARETKDDSSELVSEIQTVLDDMRFEYRSVFVMFHENGRTYEEIAEVMKCPVGTIKTWLHRARVKVLTHLRERGMVEKAIDVENPTAKTK